ncbi:MAG: DUF4838 domain-containing protein [Puniceicoccaceae bacterium]
MSKGKASLRLFVDEMEKQEIRSAVFEMQRCLVEMVGRDSVEVRLVSRLPEPGEEGVVISRRSFPLVLSEVGSDTAVWEAASGRLVISGQDARATARAVYRFLDHEGGVRWFWPGELGRHVPRRWNWRVPEGRVVLTPAFESRHLTGLRGPVNSRWGEQNGLFNHHRGLHGLQRIFSERIYLENPDLAAVPFNPEKPPGGGSTFWRQQPNLASAAVAKKVAAAARDYFEARPEAESFAIGVADNLGYGRRPEVLARIREGEWFRGRPVYTDLIFEFANGVARELEKTHPGKLLTSLAYLWGEQSPEIELHPSVVPLLTADRGGGYNVGFTVEDQELIQRWAAKQTRKLAVYEYWHGMPHLFPRQAMVLWAARLRDIREAGVTIFRGELNPHWGLDGAKPWVLVRLLEDPFQDVKVLEGEFYGDFFGPAGPALNAYFDHAEGAWMRQRGYPHWIRYYNAENGPFLFAGEDLAVMETWLKRAEEALQKSREPRYHERLEVVKEGFWVFKELHALQQERERLLMAEDPAGLASFLERATAWEMRAQGQMVAREYRPDFRGLHRYLSLPVGNFLSLAQGDARFRWSLEGELSRTAVPLAGYFLELLSDLERMELVEEMEDWGWPDRDGEVMDAWTFQSGGAWSFDGEPFEPFRGVLMEGGQLLRLEGATASGLSRLISVEGSDLVGVSVRMRASISLGNRSYFFLRWIDQGGRVRVQSLPVVLPLVGSEERLREYHLVAAVPEGMVAAEVVISATYQQPADFLEVGGVKISLWRKGEAGGENEL